MYLIDINECENSQDNLCAQMCTNTEGSYNCSCREGYERQGLTGCIGLLYTFLHIVLLIPETTKQQNGSGVKK